MEVTKRLVRVEKRDWIDNKKYIIGEEYISYYKYLPKKFLNNMNGYILIPPWIYLRNKGAIIPNKMFCFC